MDGKEKVDVWATNDKLKDRSIRMVMETAGLEREPAERLYQAAAGNIRAEIVMHETGVSRRMAARLLDENEGYVRRAIRAAGGNKDE